MPWSEMGYRAWSRALVERVAADPRVLGLVALGSMAEQGTRPDRWSDHDFFLVVESGWEEDLRRNLGWLPESDSLVFSYRETRHGVKALFRDGHLVELAVFTLAELGVARVNRYRVLLDRGGVAAALARVRAQTLEAIARESPDTGWLVGQFLTHLLVGVGRWARGEKLAGAESVRQHALRDLVELLVRLVPPADPTLADDLDPLRRFERVRPDLGRELDLLLAREPLGAARGLLDIAEREVGSRLAEFPREGLATVRRALQEAG
ncbi:MAG: hypothetical protein ACM3OB_06770 [Acidobacteriota bacterium]